MKKPKTQLYESLYEESLKNAKQWIEDAKLLMQSSSYGHASALLRFAAEETAKAVICWYVSQRIWPSESKPVRDVFLDHKAKSQVLLGMVSGIQWRKLREKGLTKTPDPMDQETAEEWKTLKHLPSVMENKRQRGIYVDLDLKSEVIETPGDIREQEVKVLLKETEFVFDYANNMAWVFPEPVREKFRKYFKSLPKEAWKTGNIRID